MASASRPLSRSPRRSSPALFHNEDGDLQLTCHPCVSRDRDLRVRFDIVYDRVEDAVLWLCVLQLFRNLALALFLQ